MKSNAATCLKKGAAFMKTVEKVFLDFVNELKIETEKPKYPLVLLIFETDDDFIRFAAEDTGGRGLSAGSMLGYYNGVTNRLVIRMSECHTFTTPLHEAIHQQVFNRGLIRRLSPVPVWFSEGIATGFEGSGERINGGPTKIHPRYARAAKRATTVDWEDVVTDDKAFRGDVLAGEAYAHAWSIHWFLLTKYRKQYVEYLQMLGQKLPLQIDDAETRTHDFEQVFGKRVGQLQSEFPAWLDQMAKKQKVSLTEKDSGGMLVSHSNLAKLETVASKNAVSGLIGSRRSNEKYLTHSTDEFSDYPGNRYWNVRRMVPAQCRSDEDHSLAQTACPEADEGWSGRIRRDVSRQSQNRRPRQRNWQELAEGGVSRSCLDRRLRRQSVVPADSAESWKKASVRPTLLRRRQVIAADSAADFLRLR